MMRMRYNKAIVLAFLLLMSLTIRSINPSTLGVDFGSSWDEGHHALLTENILKDPIHNIVFPTLSLKNGERIIGDMPPFFDVIGSIFVFTFGYSPEIMRTTSIIFGSLTVLIFFLLTNLLFDRKHALLSATIFALFPLHIALSRIYLYVVFELFLTILTSYFLILGVKNKKDSYLFMVALLVCLNFLTRYEFGLFFIAGTLFWLFLRSKNTSAWKTFKKYLLSFMIGIIAFFIWPLMLWLNSEKYISIFPPANNIWENLFVNNGINYLDISFRKVFEGYNWTGSLYPSYLFSGWNIIYTFLIITGTLIAIYRFYKKVIVQKRRISNNGLVLIWVLAFLPIHFTNHVVQHLSALIPVFSISMAIIILEINRISVKIKRRSRMYWRKIITTFNILILLFLILSPLNMIFSGKEILYETNYEKMGEYVSSRTEGYEYSAICEYLYGFWYYADKRCYPYLGVYGYSNKNVKYFIENNITRFVDVKNMDKGVSINNNDYEWLKNNCENMNKEVGITNQSKHYLYDCKNYIDNILS